MNPLIARNLFGEAFHSALRKNCDGTAAKIAWHAIDQMDSIVWTSLCSTIYRWLEKCLRLQGSVFNGELELRSQIANFTSSSPNGPLDILKLSIKLFTASDWSALIEAITVEPEDGKYKREQ